MREEITRLMSLQAIDRELRELQEALTTVSQRSVQLRQEAVDYAAELERLQLEEQQSAVARRNLEKELAENEARARNKRMRSNQVRNDRESLAVDHEIESLKETKARQEGELLRNDGGVGASAPRASRNSSHCRRSARPSWSRRRKRRRRRSRI